MSVLKFAASALLLSYIGLNNADCQIDSLKNPKTTETTVISPRRGSGSTYNMSQSKLESSLDSISRDINTDFEDAFLFHNGKVTDIGLNEEYRSVEINDSLVNDILHNSKAHDTIIFYHIHPDAYKCSRFSPPSFSDIYCHALTKPYMDRSEIVYISRMFDGRGCWEFDATDKVISRLNNDGRRQKNLCSEITSTINYNCKKTDPYGYWRVSDNWSNTMPYSSNSINRYIKAMDRIGLRLKFTKMHDDLSFMTK